MARLTMTIRNLLWRFAGVFAIAGSASAAFGSSQFDHGAATGQVPLATLALALLSFLLASYGTLLLIYGERLHNRFADALDQKGASELTVLQVTMIARRPTVSLPGLPPIHLRSQEAARPSRCFSLSEP
jgi:hypothetical protein